MSTTKAAMKRKHISNSELFSGLMFRGPPRVSSSAKAAPTTSARRSKKDDLVQINFPSCALCAEKRITCMSEWRTSSGSAACLNCKDKHEACSYVRKRSAAEMAESEDEILQDASVLHDAPSKRKPPPHYQGAGNASQPPRQNEQPKASTSGHVSADSASLAVRNPPQEPRVIREGPTDASPTNVGTSNDRNKTRFERLRSSREAFFQKLNTRDVKSVDEDFLDDLYVLAMSWRTQEDLVWPSELRQ